MCVVCNNGYVMRRLFIIVVAVVFILGFIRPVRADKQDNNPLPTWFPTNTSTPTPTSVPVADTMPTATPTQTQTQTILQTLFNSPTPAFKAPTNTPTPTEYLAPQPTPTPVVIIEWRDREVNTPQSEPGVTSAPYIPRAGEPTRGPRATPSPTPILSDTSTKARFREQLAVKQRELPAKWIAVRNDARKQLTQKVKVADKRAAAEKVILRIEQVQSLRITTMAQQLDKLGAILDEAISRGLIGGSKINEARSRIEVARSALLTQSAKTYSFSLQSDKTIKVDVEKLVHAVEFDLKSVWEILQAARRAVAVAIGARS